MKPFEVICILTDDYDIYNHRLKDSRLSVGSQYTVVRKEQFRCGVWYELAGYGDQIGFDSRLFATLSSSLNEDEEVKEKVVRKRYIREKIK